MSASSRPRPGNWNPLADSDPVPGDAEEIRHEVKHMKGVASALREQARMLRKITDDDELRGKYAGKLREDSESLEKHLREVASRYERVHVHLSNWANDLDHYQAQADKVLANAQQAQEELDGDTKKKDTGNGKAANISENNADADPLLKYRNQLNRIAGDRDEGANHYAKKIRDEIDDIIEDSYWDDVKGWIHDNVEAIKWTLDMLGWAATIIGVLAPFLAFIPFIGAIVIGISVLIAAARLVMFFAGEASLTEVFVDCIGLMVFGVGVKMLTKLTAANRATKAASQAQRTDRLKAALRANRAVRDDVARTIATTSDDGLKNFGRQTLDRMRKEISQNAGRVTDETPVAPTRLERLGFGDDNARSVIENIRRNSNTFSDGAAAARNSENYYKAAVGAAVTGATADATDKVLGESPVFPDKGFYEPYESFKGDFLKLPEDTHW